MKRRLQPLIQEQHEKHEKTQEMIIELEGDIIKNVKSVIVPNTGGLHGLAAAAAAGSGSMMHLTGMLKTWAKSKSRVSCAGTAMIAPVP